MLDIILKILSGLGILLLLLLALFFLALLLVLFFPVTYRVRGRREGESMELSAGLNWLFGILRVRYAWPVPGELAVKILWFRLLRRKLPSGEKNGNADKKSDKKEGQAAGEKKPRQENEKPSVQEAAEPQPAKQEEEPKPEEDTGQEDQNPEEQASEGQNGFLQKFKKIKYTICRIYDKIKAIWQNISYYTALLREEETGQLFAHVRLRAVKIFKSIRPRHIRAELLFGTGEPDTTGYLYGAYAAASPFLGKKCLVTPDFDRKVLEGRFDVSGHITVFVLLVNIVKLMLDKKLRRFVGKMKREGIKNG